MAIFLLLLINVSSIRTTIRPLSAGRINISGSEMANVVCHVFDTSLFTLVVNSGTFLIGIFKDEI